MGLLDSIFASPEKEAVKIYESDEAILQKWRSYSSTLPEKASIISQLSDGTHNSQGAMEKVYLEKLKALLGTEMASIQGEEAAEEKLISGLKNEEHSKKIKRIQRLEECLDYAETQHKHVHSLLLEIRKILLSEIAIVSALLEGKKNFAKTIPMLRSQLELEQEIARQIASIGTERFHQLFLGLVKGEHVIRELDDKEKKLVRRMQKGLAGVFSNEASEGITREWALIVFNAIEDEIYKCIASGIYLQHPNLDFEYVNKPEFEMLARKTINDIKKREVSEQMVNAFIHIFREWYNHGRD